MELEGQGDRLLGGGAGAPGAAAGASYGGDLRGKMWAFLVLAVSVWGLWEGKVIQGLLWNPRTNRCEERSLFGRSKACAGV